MDHWNREGDEGGRETALPGLNIEHNNAGLVAAEVGLWFIAVCLEAMIMPFGVPRMHIQALVSPISAYATP